MGKCLKFEQNYFCIGENFKDYVKNGFCGSDMTLGEWLKVLTHKDMNFLKDYFCHYTGDEIAKYIYEMYGKRIVKGD